MLECGAVFLVSPPGGGCFAFSVVSVWAVRSKVVVMSVGDTHRSASHRPLAQSPFVPSQHGPYLEVWLLAKPSAKKGMLSTPFSTHILVLKEDLLLALFSCHFWSVWNKSQHFRLNKQDLDEGTRAPSCQNLPQPLMPPVGGWQN